MPSELITFPKTDLGQFINFSLSTTSFIITLITLFSVLSIRNKLKRNKKNALCIKEMNEIVRILEKNKYNWANNPSDIDTRILSTNEQIIRNAPVRSKLVLIFQLRKRLLRDRKYLYFIKIYKELIIDFSREEI